MTKDTQTDIEGTIGASSDESAALTHGLGVLPCPFCSKAVDFEDPDTLHPSGVGWHDDRGGIRTYVRYDAVAKEQWCWEMHCPTPAGGCGANVSGDSKAEALAKWSRRTHP